jgi:pimeloyl-ACP methyl ester carboxylesterase
MQAGAAAIDEFARSSAATHAVAREAAPALSTFVADDGEAIRVWRLGAGRPVILLHGLTCSHRDWSDAARVLARTHEVFAWEARAHRADTPRGKDAPSVDRMARDLANLIDHFGIAGAVVVGHSMGAAVALEYLRQRGSARVAGMCLVDHSPRLVDSRDWRLGARGGSLLARCLRFAAALGTDASGVALRALGIAPKAMPAAPDRSAAARNALGRENVASLGRLMQSLLAVDHRDVLASVTVPVFAVFGGASPLYRRVPLARYYESIVADIRSVVYREAGHSPHREVPGRFVADLLAFIEESVSRSLSAVSGRA